MRIILFAEGNVPGDPQRIPIWDNDSSSPSNNFYGDEGQSGTSINVDTGYNPWHDMFRPPSSDVCMELRMCGENRTYGAGAVYMDALFIKAELSVMFSDSENEPLLDLCVSDVDLDVINKDICNRVLGGPVAGCDAPIIDRCSDRVTIRCDSINITTQDTEQRDNSLEGPLSLEVLRALDSLIHGDSQSCPTTWQRRLCPIPPVASAGLRTTCLDAGPDNPDGIWCWQPVHPACSGDSVGVSYDRDYLPVDGCPDGNPLRIPGIKYPSTCKLQAFYNPIIPPSEVNEQGDCPLSDEVSGSDPLWTTCGGISFPTYCPGTCPTRVGGIQCKPFFPINIMNLITGRPFVATATDYYDPTQSEYGEMPFSKAVFDIGCYPSKKYGVKIMSTGCATAQDTGCAIYMDKSTNTCADPDILSTFDVRSNTAGFFPFQSGTERNYQNYPQTWTTAVWGGGAVSITPTNWDDDYAQVGLPWTFGFYGNTYNNICVSTNGYIRFAPAGSCSAALDAVATPQAVPLTPDPNAIVAPFWADLSGVNNEFLYDVTEYSDRWTEIFSWIAGGTVRNMTVGRTTLETRPSIGFQDWKNPLNDSDDELDGQADRCGTAAQWDDMVGRVQPPAGSFSFYGSTYLYMCVSSNGMVYFTDIASCNGPGGNATSCQGDTTPLHIVEPDGGNTWLRKYTGGAAEFPRPPQTGDESNNGGNWCSYPVPQPIANSPDIHNFIAVLWKDMTPLFVRTAELVTGHTTCTVNPGVDMKGGTCGDMEYECAPNDGLDVSDCESCSPPTSCLCSDCDWTGVDEVVADVGNRFVYGFGKVEVRDCPIAGRSPGGSSSGNPQMRCMAVIYYKTASYDDGNPEDPNASNGWMDCPGEENACVARDTAYVAGNVNSGSCNNGTAGNHDCNTSTVSPRGSYNSCSEACPSDANTATVDVNDRVRGNSCGVQNSAVLFIYLTNTNVPNGIFEICYGPFYRGGSPIISGIEEPNGNYGVSVVPKSGTCNVFTPRDYAWNWCGDRDGINEPSDQAGMEYLNADVDNDGVDEFIIRWRNFHVKGLARCASFAVALDNWSSSQPAGSSTSSYEDFMIFWGGDWCSRPPDTNIPYGCVETGGFPLIMAAESHNFSTYTLASYAGFGGDKTATRFIYSNRLPYMIGLGISQDLMTDLVSGLYTSGFMCLGINTTDPRYTSLPVGFIEPLLEPGKFKSIVPGIEGYCDPDEKVEIRWTPGDIVSATPTTSASARVSIPWEQIFTLGGEPVPVTATWISGWETQVLPYADFAAVLPYYFVEIWCPQDDGISGVVSNPKDRVIWGLANWWLAADIQFSRTGFESAADRPLDFQAIPSAVARSLMFFITINPIVYTLEFLPPITPTSYEGIADLIGEIASSWFQTAIRMRTEVPLLSIEEPLIFWMRSPDLLPSLGQTLVDTLSTGSITRYIVRGEGPDVEPLTGEVCPGVTRGDCRGGFWPENTTNDYFTMYIDFFIGKIGVKALFELFGLAPPPPPVLGNGYHSRLRNSLPTRGVFILPDGTECDRCEISARRARELGLAVETNLPLYIKWKGEFQPTYWSLSKNEGMFQVPLPRQVGEIQKVIVKRLWQGKNIIEVMGIVPGEFYEVPPARMEIEIDTYPPEVQISKNSFISRDITLELQKWDNISPADKIMVSYSVDGSEFSPPTNSDIIRVFNLNIGPHRIDVKAYDEAGNEAIYQFDIGVVENADKVGCVFVATEELGKIVASVNFLIIFILPVAVSLLIRFFAKRNGKNEQ